MIGKIEKFILILIFLSILIFTCIFYRDFILENILKQLALMLWFFLRVFVLSIDQVIIWYIIIFIIAFVLFIRFGLNTSENELYLERIKNFYIEKFKSWESYFITDNYNLYNQKNLKLELIRMMVNLHAARKRISIDYHLFDAFKKKEIQIPENIHNFLYAENKKKFSINIFKIYNRISGREAGEYYRNLEECLLFLENFMEIKDDNKTI